MSTNRKLMKLAAKAAGMELGTVKFAWDEQTGQFWRHEPDCDDICGPWNPLYDDADALRLAVKLHIDLEFYVDQVWAGPNCDMLVHEFYKNDRMKAVRKAITRAAAEIGKAIP